MALAFRHPEILDIARREGKVTVDGLADHFGVTLQTIRRDLTELAEAGKLERVHGGAVLASGTSNIRYEERRALNFSGKVDIARACAALLPDKSSIFLGIGTTTEAVAAELSRHSDIMVVTNNMTVAGILAGNPECAVVVTGGTLRRSDSGLVGKLASDTLQQFKFDHAVIGCSALDLSGDLLDFDIQEVSVNQTIMRQSRNVIVVADHMKFERNAPARIGSLSEVDILITDRPLPASLREACLAWSTQVVVAGPAVGG